MFDFTLICINFKMYYCNFKSNNYFLVYHFEIIDLLIGYNNKLLKKNKILLMIIYIVSLSISPTNLIY